jgi:hypothetical protein
MPCPYEIGDIVEVVERIHEFSLRGSCDSQFNKSCWDGIFVEISKE